MMKKIWLDNEWLNETDALMSIQNRAFRYGDGIFETIACSNGKIRFIALHFERILYSAKVLKLELPQYLTLLFFENLLNDLVAQNSLTDARIRFQVFRSGNGKYLPEQNKASVLCEAELFEFNSLSSSIQRAVIYGDNGKPLCPLSNIKSSNSLVYVLASLYAQEQGADDAIILNSSGRICEATASNIFLIKSNQIYTPSLSEGCVAGVARQFMISNFDVEETEISEQMLMEADEVFITNALRSIQSVMQIDQRTFTNKRTEIIRYKFIQLIGEQ